MRQNQLSVRFYHDSKSVALVSCDQNLQTACIALSGVLDIRPFMQDIRQLSKLQQPVSRAKRFSAEALETEAHLASASARCAAARPLVPAHLISRRMNPRSPQTHPFVRLETVVRDPEMRRCRCAKVMFPELTGEDERGMRVWRALRRHEVIGQLLWCGSVWSQSFGRELACLL